MLSLYDSLSFFQYYFQFAVFPFVKSCSWKFCVFIIAELKQLLSLSLYEKNIGIIKTELLISSKIIIGR